MSILRLLVNSIHDTNAVTIHEPHEIHLSSVVRYIPAADEEQEQVRPDECSQDTEISPSIVEGKA
jgi:hypothetical protein